VKVLCMDHHVAADTFEETMAAAATETTATPTEEQLAAVKADLFALFKEKPCMPCECWIFAGSAPPRASVSSLVRRLAVRDVLLFCSHGPPCVARCWCVCLLVMPSFVS
jgi:hypothetical protein